MQDNGDDGLAVAVVEYVGTEPRDVVQKEGVSVVGEAEEFLYQVFQLVLKEGEV